MHYCHRVVLTDHFLLEAMPFFIALYPIDNSPGIKVAASAAINPPPCIADRGFFAVLIETFPSRTALASFMNQAGCFFFLHRAPLANRVLAKLSETAL